ncbi:glycine cleavage system protein GcvH [Eubacteriales bacterium OttesenSCG-928-K08]|nr:glycine cleavage system protein GcvH [Eubacteriales bacterium OttesenSCG-928-K08]
MHMTPTDRKYTKEHEWLLISGNEVKMGITDHAQSELGDIVFVELPAVGDSFAAGDSFAVVESIKAVSNIYTPLAGAVVSVNDALEDKPELLNEAPYENFIAVFEVGQVDESELLDAAAYEAFIS